MDVFIGMRFTMEYDLLTALKQEAGDVTGGRTGSDRWEVLTMTHLIRAEFHPDGEDADPGAAEQSTAARAG